MGNTAAEVSILISALEPRLCEAHAVVVPFSAVSILMTVNDQYK